MWDRVKSKLALKAAIRIGVPDGMFIALEFFQGKFPFDTMLKTAIGAGDGDVKSPGLETRECAGGSTDQATVFGLSIIFAHKLRQFFNENGICIAGDVATNLDLASAMVLLAEGQVNNSTFGLDVEIDANTGKLVCRAIYGPMHMAPLLRALLERLAPFAIIGESNIQVPLENKEEFLQLAKAIGLRVRQSPK